MNPGGRGPRGDANAPLKHFLFFLLRWGCKGPPGGREAVYPTGHMRRPLGFLPPLPSAGKWPPAEAGPPHSAAKPRDNQVAVPAPAVATHAHQPPGSQQRPSSRPQVPIGQPAPLRPKRAGGSGPFRNTFGELAALASSRRRAQDSGKPHKRGRPPPAMVTPSLATANRRLPNPPSKALCGPPVVSVPRPLMQASTGGASTTKGLTAGGLPAPQPRQVAKVGAGGKSHRRRNPHHPQSAMPEV